MEWNVFSIQYWNFFIAFMNNAFGTICWIFIQKNAHVVKKVFVNCKIFQYWIEKNVSLHVSPKNSFLEPNLIQKPTKNQNFHPKKMCWVVYSYKNWTYWFLRAYFEISAHTDVPNLFSILNCSFAMNRNPVIDSGRQVELERKYKMRRKIQHHHKQTWGFRITAKWSFLVCLQKYWIIDQEDRYVVIPFTVISHLGLEVVYTLQLF